MGATCAFVKLACAIYFPQTQPQTCATSSRQLAHGSLTNAKKTRAPHFSWKGVNKKTEGRYQEMALRGKVTVVAGATRGAGRGIACMLGEAGW